MSNGGPGEVITKPLPRYHDLPKVGTTAGATLGESSGRLTGSGALGSSGLQRYATPLRSYVRGGCVSQLAD